MKFRGRRIATFTAVMLLIGLSAFAQQPRLIQYSGIVVSTDSAATAVPFASIYNRSLRLGAVANYQGFFSFAARVGDTIEVTSVGYRKGLTVVPDIPENQAFTAIIFLEKDVKTLPEARVYPWFSREQFRDAFIRLDVPDDDLMRAQRNLNPETMAAIGANMRDPDLNARQVLDAYSYTYYYKGQYQPQAILSPTAWMQFFDALKSGAYKKK
jgi:hypothetical protein